MWQSGAHEFRARRWPESLNSAIVLRQTLLLIVVVVLSVGCKPRVGSSCEKGEARCLDGQRELICQAGKFVETACKGPAGCTANEKGTNCDFSGNKPGDPCSLDEDGAAICSGHDVMVACHGGRYALVPCRGALGCSNAEGRALCDGSLAEPGDPCRGENVKACSVDSTQVLICKQGVMQRFYQCRGKGGCTSQANKLTCDTSLARLGDACDQKLEGQAFACTPEKTAVLSCKGGAFVLEQSCKSGQVCEVNGTTTECKAPAK